MLSPTSSCIDAAHDGLHLLLPATLFDGRGVDFPHETLFLFIYRER
jgi:hypothetical protein